MRIAIGLILCLIAAAVFYCGERRYAASHGTLIDAARDGNESRVLTLLTSGAKLDLSDSSGWTALMWAVSNGHAGCVDRLLAHGANANIAAGGQTALSLAVDGHRAEIAKQLLAHHADPNFRSGSATLVYIAAGLSDTQMVEILLSGGANTRAETNAGAGLLQMAAISGDSGMVRFLTSHGVAVDGRDRMGVSPLAAAATEGSIESVKAILAAGAIVKGQAGADAIECAISSEHLEVLKLLISQGWDLNALDEQGATPLIEAVAAREGLPYVRALIAAGADVNALNSQGQTAYTVAGEYFHDQAQAILMKAGAKPDLGRPAAFHAFVSPPNPAARRP